MGQPQPDERLARAGDTSEQYESSRLCPVGLADNSLNGRNGSVCVRGRPPELRGALVLEEVPCGPHERWQGPVGIGLKKPPGIDRLADLRPSQRGHQRVEACGRTDSNAAFRAAAPFHPGRHKHRMHRPAVTVPVIAGQVACIGMSLIDIRVRGVELPLQLDHHHAVMKQEDHVRPARLHRQLVFHDRRELAGIGSHPDDLPDFALERRDVPSP